MNATRIVALLLIVAGVLGLLYGGFSYTQESTKAKIGPVELKVTDKKSVDVPVWVSVGAIVAGVALMLIKKK